MPAPGAFHGSLLNGPAQLVVPIQHTLHLETGEIRTGGRLGPFGSGSVDVVDQGILTAEGLIPFADL